MSAAGNNALIIKRKKIVAGDGHHGGAWKVAYADFVTAMMAFFLLMWLLGATSEQQRKGIADYFSPSIPLNRVSGGGDGMFEGTINMSMDGSQSGTAGEQGAPDAPKLGAEGEIAEVAALRDLERQLVGVGGESLLSEEALRHVITRLTDEGLVIEIFSLPGEPIFAPGTSDPSAATTEILEVLGRISDKVLNPVAIGAHQRVRPVVLAENRIWKISHERADKARSVLEGSGLAADRLHRLTGHGDRAPVIDDATRPRNERLEIVFLRSMS